MHDEKNSDTNTNIVENQSMQHLYIVISSSLCLYELLLVPQYIGKIAGGTPQNKNCAPMKSLACISDKIDVCISLSINWLWHILFETVCKNHAAIFY